MKDFSLINTLNKKPKEKESPLAEGIAYQEYEIEVDGKPQIVNIPLREAENFENVIVESDEPITRRRLKDLLREFRGIRG